MVNLLLEIESDQEDILIDCKTDQEDIIIVFESNQEDILIDFDFEGFYTGEYEVTPSVGEKMLATANKSMLRDVYVKPIPVKKVSAPDNKGYVVIIGE